MISFRRVKFSSVVLKEYAAHLIQKDIWLTFWCKRYQQYTCMAQCIHRYHNREEYQFNLCHSCSVRKATFRFFRTPRIILRKPREVASAND